MIARGRLARRPAQGAAGRAGPSRRVTRTIDDGFDWGSAAIGAGGAGIVLILGAAGLSAAGHRRHELPAAR
jgi:hypothetical protein